MPNVGSLCAGGSTSGIVKGLERAGYRTVAEAQRFIVKGTYGLVRDRELAKLMK